MIKYGLLRANVDINALNAEGLSSLHLAVIEGNIEVTKLLISQCTKIAMQSKTQNGDQVLYFTNRIYPSTSK